MASQDVLPDLPEARVEILASKQLLGETNYVIRLVENNTGKHRTIMRRYDDFVELDQGLRAAAKSSNAMVFLPEFPERGRSTEDFQCYLDAVLVQVPSIDLVPALQTFCNPGVTTKTREQWQIRGANSNGEIQAALAKDIFAKGTRVLICGLEKKPHYNGKEAVVVEHLAERKQYQIQVTGQDEGRLKRLLYQNLRRLDAPSEIEAQSKLADGVHKESASDLAREQFVGEARLQASV